MEFNGEWETGHALPNNRAGNIPAAAPPPLNFPSREGAIRVELLTVVNPMEGELTMSERLMNPGEGVRAWGEVLVPPPEPYEETSTTPPTRIEIPRSEVITRKPKTRVKRREVEGVCGICFMPMEKSDDDTEESASGEDDDDEEGDEDYEGYEDDSEEGDEGEQEEDGNAQNNTNADTAFNDEGYPGRRLVWCKAKCGINYHKMCIDGWIAQFTEPFRVPSCPLCRSPWRAT